MSFFACFLKLSEAQKELLELHISYLTFYQHLQFSVSHDIINPIKQKQILVNEALVLDHPDKS